MNTKCQDSNQLNDDLDPRLEHVPETAKAVFWTRHGYVISAAIGAKLEEELYQTKKELELERSKMKVMEEANDALNNALQNAMQTAMWYP